MAFKTTLTTKRKLIEWLEKELPEDDAILMSSTVDGSIQYLKKHNAQRVPFVFAAEGFKRPGDVGHIAFGGTECISFLIVSPDALSERARQDFDKLKQPIK
jgi:hypothetical protein